MEFYFSNVKLFRTFSQIENVYRSVHLSLPSVAITGRSNAGKSSLINVLCNRKNLALTSSSPGKTRTINYFHVPSSSRYKEFYLVDLPGYGFARISKKDRELLIQRIDQFLAKAPNLCLLLLIVDARRKPEQEEFSIVQYCMDNKKNFLVLLNKWDKLKQKEKNQTQKIWERSFSLTNQILPISSVKKYNIPIVWKQIVSSVQYFYQLKS